MSKNHGRTIEQRDSDKTPRVLNGMVGPSWYCYILLVAFYFKKPVGRCSF